MHQVATRRLFAADLIKAGASCGQLETFQELFPNGGVVPTLDLCLQYAGTFAWDWAAKKLLSPRGWAAYEAATAQAWASYEASRDQVWASIKEAKDQAWTSNKETKDQAWDAYEEATAQAWGAYKTIQATYDKARAQAWFEQWST